MVSQNLPHTPKYDKSKVFIGLYLNECFFLAKSLTNDCQKLFDETKPGDDPKVGFLNINWELIQFIMSICNKSVKLGNIIHNTRVQKNKYLKLAQTSRVKFISDIIGDELNLSFSNKVRHRIEHFDEYIDQISSDFVRGRGFKGREPTTRSIIVDMIASSKPIIEQFIEPHNLGMPPFYLRA